MKEIKVDAFGESISIVCNKYAKQADSSILITQGGTTVLVTAAVSDEPLPNVDFAPLTVDYKEKLFAWGKIPGGFIKREGKPTDREILVSRVIDRPLRPLIPEGFSHEIVVTAVTLSADDKYDPDILAITGGSLALLLSRAPFEGPIAGGRVIRVDGNFIINPTYDQRKNADLEIVLAVSKDAIVMVEGGAKEVSEEEFADAIFFGLEKLQPLIEVQERLVEEIKPKKLNLVSLDIPEELKKEVTDFAKDKILQAFSIKDKRERNKALKDIFALCLAHFSIEESMLFKFSIFFKKLESKLMRDMILNEQKRIDGRGLKDIRPINIEIRPLERPHGSAIFTRGQTQSLGTITLGSPNDAQMIESIVEGETFKRFMLHYNFPPFSSGEAKPWGPPRRREIGHGALAERAIEPLLPSESEFPYIIRAVSDILESNGSTSMATVCSISLALFDAGVPIKKHVGGIAMGLIKDGNRYAILSDILGDEDHLGDMDFKVAGTYDGITSVQMDIKIKGLDKNIMLEALKQAKEGRHFILSKMYEAIKEPRKEISPYAPRIETLKIPEDKIGLVIGPGGKSIKQMKELFCSNVWIAEDGTAYITSNSKENLEKTVEHIKSLIEDIELGKVYEGKITRVEKYGIFVEILPGKIGLLHISKMDKEKPESYKVGDKIEVKVIGQDEQNKPNLGLPTTPLEDKEQRSKHSQRSFQKNDRRNR